MRVSTKPILGHHLHSVHANSLPTTFTYSLPNLNQVASLG